MERQEKVLVNIINDNERVMVVDEYGDEYIIKASRAGLIDEVDRKVYQALDVTAEIDVGVALQEGLSYQLKRNGYKDYKEVAQFMVDLISWDTYQLLKSEIETIMEQSECRNYKRGKEYFLIERSKI